jgi:hypothetical protein
MNERAILKVLARYEKEWSNFGPNNKDKPTDILDLCREIVEAANSPLKVADVAPGDRFKLASGGDIWYRAVCYDQSGVIARACRHEEWFDNEWHVIIDKKD